MAVLEIDGHTFSSVPIINYEVSVEILDGKGTGRLKAEGWPMLRDPQGAIVNLNVEFGLTNSENADFIMLWNKVLSLGKQEFVHVRFTLPVGELLSQDMYAKPSPIKTRRIDRDGVVYNASWKVSFIAKEGLTL